MFNKWIISERNDSTGERLLGVNEKAVELRRH